MQYFNSGRPFITIRIAVTDTAQTLEDAGVTVLTGADGAFITCEDNNVRLAFADVVPTQGASGIGHLLVAGDYLYLASGRDIKSLRFINAANGSIGVLQVSLSKHV